MKTDILEFHTYAHPLVEAGERVGARLTAEFELLRAMYDPEALSPRLGFARSAITPGIPLLSEDGSHWPSAPVKYAIDARRSVEKWREFMPLLGGIEAAFEIGVGPGYLFRLMMDVHGTQMTGCDVEISQCGVYDAIRSELGVRHLVQEHAVARRVSTPVTPGAEAVLAFALVFDFGFHEDGSRWIWSVDDHEWFLNDIARQLTGQRRLICRFNKWWPKRDNRDVVEFYRRIGVQPLRHDKRVFVIDLKPFL